MFETIGERTLWERYHCSRCRATFQFTQLTAGVGEKFFAASNNPPSFCPVCGARNAEARDLPTCAEEPHA